MTASILKRVDAALSESLSSFAQVCASIAQETDQLARVVDKLGRGGKRIRAQLCCCGWRAAGGPDSDTIISIATALEIFHLFALIHDDLMDRSTLRRGVATAHVQLAQLHIGRAWRGDADHFGSSAAILLGDALQVWADAIMGSVALPAERGDALRAAYGEMRLQLMAGQYLDILAECRDQLSIRDAMRVARYKSGCYSVADPLRLGAVSAGADETLVSALGRIGEPVGEAFQIRDDIVGIVGRPSASGTSIGDDIKNGKHTIVVTAALARCNDSQGRRLRTLLGNTHIGDDDMAEAVNIIRESGAVEFARRAIASRMRTAQSRLADLPADEVTKGLMWQIIDNAVDLASLSLPLSQQDDR